MLDRRKPLDHAFVESMRDRIEVAKILDKLQAHVDEPEKHQLSSTQLKAADILLRKVMPDLKAVEHTEAPPRELTREQILERLAELERRGASGAAVPAPAPAIHH